MLSADDSVPGVVNETVLLLYSKRLVGIGGEKKKREKDKGVAGAAYDTTFGV